MIYSLRHVTTYSYGSPVTFAQCTLTLTPQNGAGQRTQDAAIVIEPKPKSITAHRSFFGHTVMVAEINVPHRELMIDARARVEVDRASRASDLPDPAWAGIRQCAVATASLETAAPAHFLFSSPVVRLHDAVTDHARGSFLEQPTILAAAESLMRRIHREFRYDPDATRVSTPLIEAFENRHGVCQDFAHVMIAGLRGLGLPARYVSGYIRTVPPKGQPRLEGADATHAWVDLWCGPDHGWVGFDPTNAIRAGDDHIVLATGRDYGDVAPVGGVLLGSSDQIIRVNVDVVPLEPA